jgi:hypothetical protein
MIEDISGVGLTGVRVAQTYQMLVLAKQLDAMEQEGQAALTLIQSALIDPMVGRNLDVSA